MTTDFAFGYFGRYKLKLVPLIGLEAASAVVSYYKWTLAGLTAVALGFLVGAMILGASSATGGVVIAAAFALAIGCAIVSVRLAGRGGRMASEYLTQEWGWPVRIATVKVSLRWWRWRLDLERRRMGQKT